MRKKSQKFLFNQIANLGCIVCRREMGVFTPAEIHHLRNDVGVGQRSEKVIPLCPTHHRLGGYGVAFHAGRGKFEEKYGTEEELWNITQSLL